MRSTYARAIWLPTLKHVPGKYNIADILTKACARAIFIELLRMLNQGTPVM